MRLAMFPFHVSKVLHLPRKSDPRSYEVLHLSRKITLTFLKIQCSKMQPLSGNQCPDLLSSLVNMSLASRMPRKMHLCRSSSNVPRLPSFFWKCLKKPSRHLNVQKWSEHVVLLTCWLGNVLHATMAYTLSTSQLPKVLGNAFGATAACTFSSSQLPKVVREQCVLHVLTWKCASRHNRVHFFDIATSKSAPNVRCFVHFDFGRCFAPQRRELFRHRNFKKCFKHGVLCAFWLRNALRGISACNFSSLMWLNGSAPAALASLLFDPPEPQIIGKTHWSCLFFSSPLWLFPPLLFHLSRLSEVWLLNFLR